MFKFNFNNEREVSDDEDLKENTINWYKCHKLEITSELKGKFKNFNEKEVIHLKYEGGITVKSLSPSHVIDKLKEGTEHALTDLLEAERSHSDLIPGKYEGGLKIWECTRDLVNYLSQINILFQGKNVLDLGCGAGILGIMALLKGGSVTFQDYNKEVLELITVPNVLMNEENIDVFSKTEFFSGDWESYLGGRSEFWQFNDVMTEIGSEQPPKTKYLCTKFDYILSSETIYNPLNYVKIHNIIHNLMKLDGVCYMAAKKCYFGVGGNTQSFKQYLEKDNIFNIETCWFSDEGVAREILKITFRKS